jgi:hypothetical protein
VEYPLVLSLSLFALVSFVRRQNFQKQRISGPLGLCALLLALVFWQNYKGGLGLASQVLGEDTVKLVFWYALPFFCIYTLRFRPWIYAPVFTLIVLVFNSWIGEMGAGAKVQYAGRNFYGSKLVVDDEARRFRSLQHGNIVHGMQSLESGKTTQPLAYFERSGPVGQVFSVLMSRPAPRSYAVIGLGAGTMSCYAGPGDSMDFYELDPEIKRIALDLELFSYIKDSLGQIGIILGDGRLKLKEAPSAKYDLLMIDTFSSDAIPVHLITQEAIELYASKIKENGTILFHISNRYLRFEPVLGRMAWAQGFQAVIKEDGFLSRQQMDAGKFPSDYVLFTKQRQIVEDLKAKWAWRELKFSRNSRPWSDKFSNIVEVNR